MVAGPEPFHEWCKNLKKVYSCQQRSEATIKPAIQSTFSKDVSYFEEFGNSIQDENKNLMAIHTKDIMDDDVVNTIQSANKVGD